MKRKTKVMKKSSFILMLVLAIASCDQQKKEPQNPCKEFDQVDREMLDLIESINLKQSQNKKFLSKFRMEQVFWTQYRDTHLEAIYPEDWSTYYRKRFGKEVFNPCKCEEMIRFTKLRIEELKFWTDTPPKGQSECPSLWNK